MSREQRNAQESSAAYAKLARVVGETVASRIAQIKPSEFLDKPQIRRRSFLGRVLDEASFTAGAVKNILFGS